MEITDFKDVKIGDYLLFVERAGKRKMFKTHYPSLTSGQNLIKSKIRRQVTTKGNIKFTLLFVRTLTNHEVVSEIEINNYYE